MFSSHTKSGPNSYFKPKPFFKIVDFAFDNVGWDRTLDKSHATQYLVLYDRDDPIQRSQWLTGTQLKECLKIGGSETIQLYRQFKNWYTSNRFGGAPHTGVDYMEAPLLSVEVAVYRLINYQYIDNTNKYFGATLKDYLDRCLSSANRWFSFSTGFSTRVCETFKNGVDKKITELLFFRDVFKQWRENQIFTYSFKLARHMIGQNCYYKREANCVNAEAERRGLGLFKYLSPREAIEKYGDSKKEIPLVMIYSLPTDYVPNMCCVVVVRWNDIPYVWIPLQHDEKYGLNTTTIRQFARSFGTGDPCFFYEGLDTRHDSLIRCLQLVARLLDGTALFDALTGSG